MLVVYTVAITTSPARSSTTASVSRNTRIRVADLGVTSATVANAKAVSVDIAAPQPFAPDPPASNAMSAGDRPPRPHQERRVREPRSAAAHGTLRDRAAAWDSSPTTKKNLALPIRPSLTQCRRSASMPALPSRIDRCVRPQRLIAMRPWRVGPHQRRNRGRQHHSGAARLRSQEAPDRRGQVPGPRRPASVRTRRALSLHAHHRHATAALEIQTSCPFACTPPRCSASKRGLRWTRVPSVAHPRYATTSDLAAGC